MGIYVVVIQGEVATVADMDDATKAKVEAKLAESGLRTSIVGPLDITTSPFAIDAEVEAVLDGWEP